MDIFNIIPRPTYYMGVKFETFEVIDFELNRKKKKNES